MIINSEMDIGANIIILISRIRCQSVFMVCLSFSLQLGEKSSSYNWQQLLKYQSHSRIQRVIAYDYSIT